LEKLKAEVSRLEKENKSLKEALMQSGQSSGLEGAVQELDKLADKALSIVVIGASGDLAKKKTYPALFALFDNNLLPKHAKIIGYARSDLPDSEFKKSIGAKLKADEAKKKQFLDMCSYVSGKYDSIEDFKKLDDVLVKIESVYPAGANRMFYFAIPPSVFAATGNGIRASAMSATGWNRLVVEKPFGRDSASSAVLAKALLANFTEDQIYRIDHYLGKEMVQNLMVLRFANTILEPVWNSRHVANVTITFKEDIGTQGRGGYFDEFGIIRDVMQNHLFQILTLIAMEPPVTLGAEDVRTEKVKVLRAIEPLNRDRLVIGQYTGDAEKKEPGYKEDPGVPVDSVTPTFAAAVFFVKNSRWDGVPFILKCGKALNERKAEIRIQFKPLPGQLYDAERNELVMRVQPDEAVYLKVHTKEPGLSDKLQHVELNLTYKQRFDVGHLPDAYERLILDVLRGDHNLFVRGDELIAAWHIFTPILHQLEEEKIAPILYKFGSRGPKEADDLIKKYGYLRSEKYTWTAPSPKI